MNLEQLQEELKNLEYRHEDFSECTKSFITGLIKSMDVLRAQVQDLSRTVYRTLKLVVPFKKLNPKAQIPQRNGAAFDLFIPEDVTVNPGETVKIRLGFACKLPPGYHALINVRSSTWKKWGICLTNQTGIIDNAYCGNEDEWILSVYRLRDFADPITIPAGTRIAQFRLDMDAPEVVFEEVDELPDPTRGGFGSTGD